ncbi:MAG: hypothetical protein AVDCRST_MAG89-1149 [uncultured Gemmatimonadetes bacterium]|uniref:Uncharacterized protein n=1 Tax=uncultured Gemmatimonadota bacterium TaxID=203437 RepID=A0A6J4KR12_9BACT|nr:MAG: hypothetical protein AVDCRST_MAG89-1149 [uncultured Gemmatimonadota bacterium]
MTNRGFLNFASDTFAYLYQRRAGPDAHGR